MQSALAELGIDPEKAAVAVPVDLAGTVTEVHVAAGDAVAPGDDIFSYNESSDSKQDAGPRDRRGVGDTGGVRGGAAAGGGAAGRREDGGTAPATATGPLRGLVVPVLAGADRLDVDVIEQRLEGMAERAWEWRLEPDEFRGATCTLSNLGGLGGGWFTPIVDVPAAAILGVGRAVTEPAWIDGACRPVRRCPLSLSYDHRLVDGADAARFLGWLTDALADPLLLLLGGNAP